MRHLAPLLLCLALVACGPHWVGPIDALPGPVPERQVCLQGVREPAVVDAIREWDRATKAAFRLLDVAWSEGSTCDITIREVPGSDDPGPHAAAWTQLGPRAPIISLRRGYYELDPQWFAAHELGHALGAQHLDWTLMHYAWEPGLHRCPDRTTVAQVAAYQHLPIELFGWCQ